MVETRTLEILLVEDNAGDADLTREGFKRSKACVNLNVLCDGEDVLPFLRREGKFEDAPPPDLILLDLNLPGKDGREVLIEIKVDPKLRQIPVVVMTSSEAEEDIFSSYAAHANCYVPKPVDLTEFLGVIGSIQDFWFTHAKLPARAGA